MCRCLFCFQLLELVPEASRRLEGANPAYEIVVNTHAYVGTVSYPGAPNGEPTRALRMIYDIVEHDDVPVLHRHVTSIHPVMGQDRSRQGRQSPRSTHRYTWDLQRNESLDVDLSPYASPPH